MASAAAPASAPAATSVPAPPRAAAAATRRTPLSVAGVEVLAGFCAGINVTLVGHPLETVKVRLQTQPSPPHHLYNGTLDCIRKTVQAEGAAGLYRGVGAPLGGQLFFRSLLFTTYAKYLAFMQARPTPSGAPHALSYAEFGFGGASAWAVGSIIECPLQVTSSQLQTQLVRVKAAQAAGLPPPVVYGGVVDYLRRAPSAFGLRALYRGFGVHIARNIPGGFVHFAAFEATRREYAAFVGKPVTEIGLLANMACGAIGGVCFWGITFPIDAVKSALQGDSLDPRVARYSGALDAARKLWAEGGVARFARGLDASMLRAVPANAVLLATASIIREKGYAYLDGPSE